MLNRVFPKAEYERSLNLSYSFVNQVNHVSKRSRTIRSTLNTYRLPVFNRSGLRLTLLKNANAYSAGAAA